MRKALSIVISVAMYLNLCCPSCAAVEASTTNETQNQSSQHENSEHVPNAEKKVDCQVKRIKNKRYSSPSILLTLLFFEGVYAVGVFLGLMSGAAARPGTSTADKVLNWLWRVVGVPYMVACMVAPNRSLEADGRVLNIATNKYCDNKKKDSRFKTVMTWIAVGLSCAAAFAIGVNFPRWELDRWLRR